MDASRSAGPSDSPEAGVVPRALCDMHAILASTANAPPGVVWKMEEVARQLDANLLNLPANKIIGAHTETDLDVLVIVIAGTGTFTSGDTVLLLIPGELVWLPRGSTRTLTAGPNGLAYVTVHQRRPGMQIRVGR